MEVEEQLPPPRQYTFTLADGGSITISADMVANFYMLQTMLSDFDQEEEDVLMPISLSTFITTPIMQWIVDAYRIYEARERAVTDLDDLYKDIEYHNKLMLSRYKDYTPLLILFNRENQIPIVDDLDVLFELARDLNWLDAGRVLYLVLEKIYQLVDPMTSQEIENLFATKKRKHEDETTQLSTVPFVPYYKREELIIESLSQSLPLDLLRPNRSLQKLINPISGSMHNQLFLTVDGLYEYRGYNKSVMIEKVTTLSGTPLLVASGYAHALCLTSTGLYGRGSNIVGELGLGKNKYIKEWTKIDIDGEVLLLEAGKFFTVILTTTGLYSTGSNNHGQLGLGNTKSAYEFTHIKIESDVSSISCSTSALFVLMTTGLYACGCNTQKNLAIPSEASIISLLTQVSGLTGIIKKIALGEDHTMVLTGEGLFGSGNNFYGQMGDKNQKTKKMFTQLSELPASPISVYCGKYYTIILTKDGLYATGNNRKGQLALGKEMTRNVTKFTKIEGVQGDVQNVTCLSNAVILFTTTGVYQSGKSLGLPTASFVMQNADRFYTFTKLDIEMGYTFLSSLSEEKEKEEPQRKQQKLQCEYCRNSAQFFCHIDKLAFCSKYCKLRIQ